MAHVHKHEKQGSYLKVTLAILNLMFIKVTPKAYLKAMPIILNLAVCWFWQSEQLMVCGDQDMDQIAEEP